MFILKRIWRGSQYHPAFDSHPGTVMLVIGVIVGALVAGSVGALMMGFLMGVPYTIGCYIRGEAMEKFDAQGGER